MAETKSQPGFGLPGCGHQRALVGFTLVAMLISLAILGVIVTYIIPKVIHNQQSSGSKTAAHENPGIINVAYQQLQISGQARGTPSHKISPHT